MPKSYAERIKGVTREKATSVRFTPEETFYLEFLAHRDHISTSAYLAKLIQKKFKAEKNKIITEADLNEDFFEFAYESKGISLLKKFYLSNDFTGNDRKIMDYILDCKNCLTIQDKQVVIDAIYVHRNFDAIKSLALKEKDATTLPENKSHATKPVPHTLKGEKWDDIFVKGW